ncbi:MAG: FIST C-terminal domain-containing protein [Oligoflexia bacterium]|nr:FIST C-terminal domain-containing protein [Oligoflexia bacterium]
MSLKTKVVQSTKKDGYEAGQEVASKLLKELGERPDFLILNCNIGYEMQDLLDGIKEKMGDIPMSGSTWEGVIGQNFVDESLHSVQLVGMRSDSVKFHNFCIKGTAESSELLGEELGNEFSKIKYTGNKLLFLTPDFRLNVTTLFKGIDKNFKVDIVGGLAGDNFSFQKCYQFNNWEILTHSAPAILMVGDFKYKTLITHGSEPIGEPEKITKTHLNQILEIGNQPALDVLSKHFGETITPKNQANAVLCAPIAKKLEGKFKALSPYIMSAVLGMDFEKKFIFTPVLYQEGEIIQFMRRSPKGIIDSNKSAAEMLRKEIGNEKILFAAQYDCGGRGKSMFANDTLEIATIFQKILGKEIPWFGTFTFGEISPLEGTNYFHNYTGTVVVIY